MSKGDLAFYIAFYIANGCTYLVRKDVSVTFEGVLESLCIELLVNQKTILFAEVYCHPNGSFISFLEILTGVLEKFHSMNFVVIFMSDF